MIALPIGYNHKKFRFDQFDTILTYGYVIFIFVRHIFIFIYKT